MTAALQGAPGVTGGTGAPDALDSLRHWRLRPGVTASALARGLHLRGWITSITLEGSPALPALWRMVEDALRTGGAADLAARTGAGTPLRGALCTLIGQLHAHGMLVEDVALPAAGPAHDWLLKVAARPADAAAALAAARVEVRAAGPGGALVTAALRALAHAGVGAARYAPGAGTSAGGPVLLTATLADGTERAVGAAVHPDGAFVTPVGARARAGTDTAALAERLGIGNGNGNGNGKGGGGNGFHDSPAPGAPTTAAAPPALTALVAGAAVQRLLCAVTGLPDPESADDPGDPGRPARFPSALVAGQDPAHAAYHPWLGGPLDPAPPPATLDEALAGVAALGDARLGVLPAPLAGSLPQLPVALAGCAAPGGGRLTAGAGRADLARLDALCRAAELRLGAERPGAVVGAGPGHAVGRALRRAAVGLPGTGSACRDGYGDGYGGGHRQARHWWSVLTRRLGVRAELTVTGLDAGGTAYRAEVRAVGRARGPLLGQAVEATAGDAAAFAALAAVVRVQAGAAEPAVRHITSPGGELCPLATAGVDPAPWEDEGWPAGWWARVAGHEAALHATLFRLTGLRAFPWEPAGPRARTLVTALRGCGFTVLDAPDGVGTDTEGGSR
ncbi:hypothetical protein [Streptomyces sp. NBC_01276]|uniref:hypothetical protein n=1 Tax=Streptomyces sp. NBC_01276 TaxID=2903808 RepID=UPI00352F7141